MAEQTNREQEIRARCEQATKGPWKPFTVEGALLSDVHAHRGNGSQSFFEGNTLADGKFIAAAREDVSYLLDALATLRAEHARLTEAVKAMTDGDEGTVRDIIAMAVRLGGDVDDPNRAEVVRLFRHVVKQGDRVQEQRNRAEAAESREAALREALTKLIEDIPKIGTFTGITMRLRELAAPPEQETQG